MSRNRVQSHAAFNTMLDPPTTRCEIGFRYHCQDNPPEVTATDGSPLQRSRNPRPPDNSVLNCAYQLVFYLHTLTGYF